MIDSRNSTITFNKGKDPDISFYETIPWKVNEFHNVEFFSGKIIRVFLISNQYEDMENILRKLESNNDDKHKNSDNDNMIAIDLEWEYNKLCLIQFCANKISIIIRLFTTEDLEKYPELKTQKKNDEYLLQKNHKILENFLNTHKFYGKGMHNDEKMLLLYFGKTFSNNFEDIEKTRLIPNELSRNFNQMTKLFAGEPTSSFKVIEMTKSDWSVSELSFRQVLYAAFDTVALFYCYPNFPPIQNQIESKPKSEKKNKKKNKEKKQKNKIKQNVKYYKLDKKGPKMNLSIEFKEIEKKETFSYLIKNYKGIKNKLILRSLLSELDFISYFDTDSTSYLFISSFKPIKNFSKFLPNISQIKINIDKTIEITEPDEALSCKGIEKISEDVFYLPKVPISLFNDTDVLFVTNIPDSIFSEEKLQDLFYCFGYDQIVSRIDDKNQNSCIVEPRNFEISRRIRTFLPFLTIDDKLLKLYEFPSFLRTVRLSNIPSNFTEDDLKKLYINKEKYIVKSSEFIIKRIDSDSQTAYVMFETLQDKQIFTSKFNHFKLKNLEKIANYNLNYNDYDDNDELLVIPFSSDVHYRYMRSYEINVYLKNRSQLTFDDIYDKFAKFGKIFQMNYDKRFNNYHVQYYRKCDSIRAYEYIKSLNNSEKENLNETIHLNDDDDKRFFTDQIIIEMHPEGSTIIIRDLPLEITESELITLLSKYGRITNLIFRDLTPMNMLSIADIYFSSPEEANEVKKMMNKSKIGGTSIYVSIRCREDLTSRKMSQRNQWVVFDEDYKTIDDVFTKTSPFGKIIDYFYSNDHFLAMFDSSENAKTVIEKLNLCNPTYIQFVEETSNSKYLRIVQKPSISGNPVEQKESVIVVDPIQRNLTEDFIEKIFLEGSPTSANEASKLVSASSLMLPSSKDLNGHSKSSSEKNECQIQHELYIVDSVKFSGKKRLIIYSPSNNVTKKLFTLLKNSKFEDQYFKPKKIDLQDLDNPPQRKIKKNIFEGHEVNNPVIIIDPLPKEFGDKEIRETIKDIPDLELVICKSSKVVGKMRAVLMPKITSQKRVIHKALSRKIINNENLHIFEYKFDSIPLSL